VALKQGSKLHKPFNGLIHSNNIRIQFVPPRKHYVSATNPNRLTLFGKTVAAYCENHTEHTDTLCGQNAEFQYVKVGGMYRNHRVLRR
jgi:hypothetical protein